MLPVVTSSLTLEVLEQMDTELAQKWALKLMELPAVAQRTVQEFGRERCQDFITEVLGEKPTDAAKAKGYLFPWTPDQEAIFESVRNHSRTAVYSGHSVGKSFGVSRLALWALYSVENTIVITTAPNKRQVERVLWGRIRAAFAQSKTKLPGRMLLTSLKLDDMWHATGFTARVATSDPTATGFQGEHQLGHGRVVVIGDEATGIPEQVHEAMKRITTGANDRIVLIGNPTDPDCYFAKVQEFKHPDGRPLWNCITVSCENHPNIIHNDPNLFPGAVTQQFLDTTLAECGGNRDSAVWRTSILGLFAKDNKDGLISLAWLERAQRRLEALKESGERRRASRHGISLGVDVAGSGEDLTIVSAIQNDEWWIPEIDGVRSWCQGRDPMDVADLIVRVVTALREVRVICIDDTGIGKGVTARLLQLQREKKLPRYRTIDGKMRDVWIIGKNFGGKPGHALFVIAKDELWWDLREALREDKLLLPNEQDMATWGLPRGNSLRAQLTTPIYFRSGSGGEDGQRIKVYDKRGAHGEAKVTQHLPTKSPDIAHSCMLSWHGYKRLRIESLDVRPAPRDTGDVFDEKTRELVKKGSRGKKPKPDNQRSAMTLPPWMRTRMGK
jgi:phage terminase large subunit